MSLCPEEMFNITTTEGMCPTTPQPVGTGQHPTSNSAQDGQEPPSAGTLTNTKVRSYARAKKNNSEVAFESFMAVLDQDQDAARHIFTSNEEVKNAIASIRTLFVDLQATCDKMATNIANPPTCTNCLPDPPSFPPSPPTPESTEEQERLFWFQNQWKKLQPDAQRAKKTIRSAADEKEDYEQDCRFHEKFGWMVDEDGKWQRVSTLSEATAIVRAALITLENWGKLGPSFTLHTGIEAKVWIVTLLERTFPWLALCAAHWKALYLVQEVAHGYLQTLRKNKSKTELPFIKSEDTSDSVASLSSGAVTPSITISSTTTPVESPATLKRKLEDVAVNIEAPGHSASPIPTYQRLPRLSVLRRSAAASASEPAIEPVTTVASQWSPPTGPIPAGAPPPWETPNQTPGSSVAPPSPAPWTPSPLTAPGIPSIYLDPILPGVRPLNSPAPYGDNSGDEDEDSDAISDDENSGFGSGGAPLQAHTTSLFTQPSSPMYMQGPPPTGVPASAWHRPQAPTAGHQLVPPTNWTTATAPKKKSGRPKAPGKSFAFADWKAGVNAQGDDETLQTAFGKIWTKLPSAEKKAWNDFAIQKMGGAPAIAAQNSAAIQFNPPNAVAGPMQPKPKKVKRP